MRQHSTVMIVLMALSLGIGCADRQTPGVTTDGAVFVPADGGQQGDGVIGQNDGWAPKKDGWTPKKDGWVGKKDGWTTKGCTSSAQCKIGEVCDINGCGPNSYGQCVTRPAICNKIYKPECGCDGKTYPNSCERIKAGVPFKSAGPCGSSHKDGGLVKPDHGGRTKQCSAKPGQGCNPGFTCNIKACGKGSPGQCVVTPTQCPAIYKPVCGCDKKTYGNDCLRIKAAVALFSLGAC